MTFNINLWSIKNATFGYHSNEFVKNYSRFSESYCSICFLVTKFDKFLKVKSDFISETSTQKYLQIPNFSQINEGVWELRVSEIIACTLAKIQVMTS